MLPVTAVTKMALLVTAHIVDLKEVIEILVTAVTAPKR